MAFVAYDCEFLQELQQLLWLLPSSLHQQGPDQLRQLGQVGGQVAPHSDLQLLEQLLVHKLLKGECLATISS